MTDEDDDDALDNWDSGPWCQHWSDPDDCMRICTCGHVCSHHDYSGVCGVRGCDCEEFTDPEEE